ncbi:hypothetical protein SAMD00019534_005290, partial [Acytostelium subglobosum LB1]|uniref:hypothetical protein n=1 Tax=Acytostelium subglobosum LB1 TaxID=1410327 RepID=UPI000644FC77
MATMDGEHTDILAVNCHPDDNEATPLLVDDSDDSKRPLRDKNLYNIIILGIAFCVMFTAFSPTQNLETTINQTMGSDSLSILYACLSVSNFVSPLIVLKLGEKLSLILGTVTYVTYIAANIYTNAGILYPASALLGFGAAVLWTAEGAFVIRCSNEKTLGFHTGLFFALFQVNQIIGNLGTAQLLKAYSDRTLFIILTIACASSILIFLLIGNPGSKKNDKAKEAMPFQDRLLMTFSILKERPVQMLIIALLYSGMSQAFFFGAFPPLIGKEMMGYVMTVFGVCDALGSVFIGKLSDIIGRKSLIIVATMACMGGTIFSYIIDYHISEHKVILYGVCAGLMGIADAGYNTLLYSLLGTLYPTKGESAAAVFKFVQAIASAAAFLYGPHVNYIQNVIIVNSFVVPSCLLYIAIEVLYAPKKAVQSEVTVQYVEPVFQSTVQKSTVGPDI